MTKEARDETRDLLGSRDTMVPMSGEPGSEQCAEIIGGNRPMDASVVLPDLDLWLYSRPQGGAAEGGDVVFVSLCDRGGVTKAYLGDVAGHGATVAPAARALNELVRRHLDDLDHRAFLRSLNTEARSGLFATMVAVAFDREHSLLKYAYAGHPHLLLRREGSGGFEWLGPEYCTVPGKLADLAIGVVAETRYFQSGVPFREGDMAVLFSDGFAEALRPNGTRPGFSGLRSIADRCSSDGAGSFCRDLLRLYAMEFGIESFSDDISLVIMKRTAKR